MDANALLYLRGFLYAYGAMLTFLASLLVTPRTNGRMSRAHSWQKRVLALFFLCLSVGGLSSLVGAPAVWQVFITYGATALIVAYDVLITFFVIFRK